jgi:hypothetical protein
LTHRANPIQLLTVEFLGILLEEFNCDCPDLRAGQERNVNPFRCRAGFGPFCEALREVIEPLHIPGTGIRIASEFGWITAELRSQDS